MDTETITIQRNTTKRFAHVIKPFNGRSRIVRHRSPRKTAAVKVVLRELEESTEGVEPLYVNCCKNTTFKVYVELCHTLGQIHPKQKSEDLPKSSRSRQQESSSIRLRRNRQSRRLRILVPSPRRYLRTIIILGRAIMDGNR